MAEEKEKPKKPEEIGKERKVKEEKKPVGTAKKEEKKKEVKKETRPKPKIRKTQASVSAHNLPISTKQSSAICKFIKKKKIADAINELEKVLALKKAIPMIGEIPHRKGKIMSGRFPKKAAQHFLVLLKSLASNADMNELNEPVITEASANTGSRPYGRFGRIRRKRTHIKIKAKEKKKK